MIVLNIREAPNQLGVIPVEPLMRAGVLESIPELILEAANLRDIEVCKGRQRMTAKGLRPSLGRQSPRHLSSGTCERVNRHWVMIIEKERQRSAELAPRYLSFVKVH
jgi:hypothetical protein